MTISEMNELKNEYGDDMRISPAGPHIHDDPYSWNKYNITYKGIIVGSELVSADSIRQYINDLLKNHPHLFD